MIMVHENRELRKIFEPKSQEIIGDWRKLEVTSFMNFTPHQILFG